MRTKSAAPAAILLGAALATTPAMASSDVDPTGETRLPINTTTDVAYLIEPAGATYALSVHAPSDPGPWPTVVMIHGGGGAYGASILDRWAEAVAAEGAVVFVPRWASEYLSSDVAEASAALADFTAQLACVVRFARSEAERFGGDPAEVSLFGHSAGAHFASVIALTDPVVSPDCLADADSAIPESLALFEGDWLLMGHPVWDSLLTQDRSLVWDAQTPWPHLADAPRLPVTMLDSNDPTLAVHTQERIDEKMALRDPDGTLHEALDGAGALADERLTETEAQRLLADELVALGYPVSFIDLPDSDHERLSEAALAMLADALISRRREPT